MFGFCKDCQKEQRVTSTDVGIGSYEFWGSRSSDSQWVPTCTVCDSEEVYTDEDCDRKLDMECFGGEPYDDY